MAKASFWQRGEALDYMNNTESVIEANAVIVFGSRIAVAGCDIAPGELGSIHVEGVFEFPKDSAAIEAGATVFWKDDAATASAGSSPSDANLKIGYAVQAATSDETTVLVKINA